MQSAIDATVCSRHHDRPSLISPGGRTALLPEEALLSPQASSRCGAPAAADSYPSHESSSREGGTPMRIAEGLPRGPRLAAGAAGSLAHDPGVAVAAVDGRATLVQSASTSSSRQNILPAELARHGRDKD